VEWHHALRLVGYTAPRCWFSYPGTTCLLTGLPGSRTRSCTRVESRLAKV